MQEELLTRQMRYMSNLDEVHFQSEVVNAAKSAIEGDPTQMRASLQNCYDVLTEARERFYPAEAYLVDLVLVAPTTLGPALQQELNQGLATNFLISGETLEKMAAEAPETLQALRDAQQRETVTIVGGEYTERETPLLPIEAALRQFEHGREIYQQVLGAAPEVYGRRRFGLTPALPQILSRSGFIGAVHFTLDDGQFPRDDQSKSRWEGLDSSAIDMLTKVPFDVSQAEKFLGFCERMGEAMDLDHVATLTFRGGPGSRARGTTICAASPGLPRC